VELLSRARIAAVAVVLAIALGSPPAHAEDGTGQASDASLERRVKAAFLYNFAVFVEWPADAIEDRPVLDSCILGDNELADALERAVVGKRVHGKQFAVRRLTTVDDVAECHLLYLAPSHRMQLGAVLEAVETAPVLIVGDAEDFVQWGGMVNFRREKKKLRFEINVDNANDAGLRISSKLLNLARIVWNGEGGRE
jgi:hypothetical protein